MDSKLKSIIKEMVDDLLLGYNTKTMNVNENDDEFNQTIKNQVPYNDISDGEIPNQFVVDNINFILDEENAIDLINITDSQLHYNVNYVYSINNVRRNLIIPISISIDFTYTMDKYEIEPEIIVDKNSITIK